MANKTNIGWTDATWNPVTGCSKVSTGCKNCYAAANAPRLAKMGAKGYTELPWTSANAAQNVKLHYDRVPQPMHMKRGHRIFTCSMADLFHPEVSFDFLDKILAVMALAPQHTFQILTKRPQRMAAYLAGPRPENGPPTRARVEMEMDLLSLEHYGVGQFLGQWPLANVWLGTSVEDQRAANERIPHLLTTPAATRFISCEPLLGPVDLTNVPLRKDTALVPTGNCLFADLDGNWSIDWIIAGGESGPDYRAMELDWARSLREQARAASVPFFFKQSSGPRPETGIHLDGQIIRQFPDDPG